MTIRNPIRCTKTQTLLIVTVLSPLALALGQSQNQTSTDKNPKSDEQIIKCFQTYIATVKVAVTDRHGNEIADLTKDDFTIYEDDVKQEMCYWKRNVGSGRQADQPMYEAGYYPINSLFRGEWRKIRVLVGNKDKRKLKVQFTPQGYYANEELRKN